MQRREVEERERDRVGRAEREQRRAAAQAALRGFVERSRTFEVAPLPGAVTLGPCP